MQVKKGFKAINETNPIITQRFGADPYAMEYNDRVYVYMTNDVPEFNEEGKLIDNTYQKINTINCVSSEDMVNWTDHGSLPVAGSEGAAKWANNSWAPAAAHKKINGKEKFFLYFADSARGIGVITSDTPIGPWTDPIGGPLVSKNSPNCADVVWCFDPAVWVEEDGRAYLYFGGGVPEGKAAMPNTARAVELGENMISLKGTPVTIEAPYLFEDSGINRIDDTYYYSYCTNFLDRDDPGVKVALGKGQINYMTSKNPLGPFEYQKMILRNPDDFFGGGYGNNHHCILHFKGEYYMFWHTQTLRVRMELEAEGYRCTHVDRISVKPEGGIEPIKGSYQGVSQLKPVNPYEGHRTDTFAWEAGITNVPDQENRTVMCLSRIHTGGYIGIAGVGFEGTSSITVTAGSRSDGCMIYVHLDHPDSKPYAKIPVPRTQNPGSLSEASVSVESIKGSHNLFFVFEGDGFMFETWKFIR